MDWTSFLQGQGARENARDFGDPAGELDSARTATVIVPLGDMGVIAADGEDAVGFLQNLLTNDIKGLGQSGACLAGICNPKGRLLATMVVWPDEQGLRLALSADLVPTVQKRLAMYVLRSKVRVSDASKDAALLGLSGPKAAALLTELGAEAGAKLARFPGGSAISLGGDRYLLALKLGAAEEVWLQLAKLARPAGLAAWHWLEIVAGIPRVTAANQEEFVPQMLNYELLGGVSFSKGCYPGQEIVARTQHLGKIKRRMYRVHSPNELSVGAALYAPLTEDQACGAILQVAPSPSGGMEALAVVQSNCFEAGDVHLGATNGPALRFLPLPYDKALKDS